MSKVSELLDKLLANKPTPEEDKKDVEPTINDDNTILEPEKKDEKDPESGCDNK